MLTSGKLTPSTIPQLHLNGAQSLQPFTAYGLQALCLRLTPTVTGTRSRLDNRCGGSPLSVQYFQLLANKCLVAHQSLMQISTGIGSGFSANQHCNPCLQYGPKFADQDQRVRIGGSCLRKARKYSSLCALGHRRCECSRCHTASRSGLMHR